MHGIEVGAQQLHLDNEMRWMAIELLKREPFHTGEWHAMDTSGSTMHQTYELMGATADIPVVSDVDDWVYITRCNMPWAEEHFQERVSGQPLNPPPSHVRWPYAQRGNATHTDALGDKFSHTYPERFWPKFAGNAQWVADTWDGRGRQGIRYAYGDLSDVVDLLVRSPLTRQAYLPVWFPEDTGAVEKQRVPCSMGYHFLIRDGQLHCWYAMRSCDFVRHFRDDIYHAGRLMQWVCDQYNEATSETGEMMPTHSQKLNGQAMKPFITPGTLHMTMSSLHAFVGDNYRLKRMADGEWS